MHGLMDWRSALVFAMYLYACAFLLCVIIDGVKSLATRTAAHRVRARLARRRAYLAEQRNTRTRESARAAALAIMAASPKEGILSSAIGPATRARLMGVDELMMDDGNEERELFI